MGASFFFQGFEDRSNIRLIFPKLAYKDHDFQCTLVDFLWPDQSIPLQQSPEKQARKLVVEPPVETSSKSRFHRGQRIWRA